MVVVFSTISLSKQEIFLYLLIQYCFRHYITIKTGHFSLSFLLFLLSSIRIIQYNISHSIIIFYLNAVNSSNGYNSPLSTQCDSGCPVNGESTTRLGMASPSVEGLDVSSAMVSIWRRLRVTRDFVCSCMKKWRCHSKLVEVVPREGNFVYLRWRQNRWCRCQEIGVVVSHFVDKSYSLFQQKKSRSKILGSDKPYEPKCFDNSPHNWYNSYYHDLMY